MGEAGSESLKRLIDEAAGMLRAARSVVVMTGAGVSAESGIRTFRDTMEGLWKEFDPAKLATPEAFERDPETVTKWYDWRRKGCLAAEPNAGHLALAELERRVVARGGRFTLLTQNVDRLHQRAGSANVVELHGSIMEWRCTATGKLVTPREGGLEAFPTTSPFDPRGLLRPNVVWFGELLPETALAAAEEATAASDVFMSVGTSSVVYPAAAYLRLAAARGARTIEVNRDVTAASGVVDVAVRGLAGAALPKMVQLVWEAAK